MIALIEKYSDLLELYSAVISWRPETITFVFPSGHRTSIESIGQMIAAWTLPRGALFHEVNSRQEAATVSKRLAITDGHLCAPFVRYREFWSLVPVLRRQGVRTTHLSEALADTFGHIGYRIGYRGRAWHTWISIPYFKYRALFCMPDECFSPCAPEIRNPFVKTTHETLRPPLSRVQKSRILNLLGEKSRPLLLGGFGYDIEKMANHLGISTYVATTKSRGIIVDGVHIPLEMHLCAEEILMSGLVTKLVSYTSTAVVWAKRWYPELEISCYRARALDRQYGPIFSFLAAKALLKMGVIVQQECAAMLGQFRD